jgi:hypothetical protein
MTLAKLLDTFWTMHTIDGMWYPIQPSDRCRAEDHAVLNKHIVKICDADGKTLWERPPQ